MSTESFTYIKQVEQEEYPENPRDFQEPLGLMLVNKRHYAFGGNGENKKARAELWSAFGRIYERMTREDREWIDYDYDDSVSDLTEIFEKFEKYNLGIAEEIYIREAGASGYVFATWEMIRNWLNVKSIHNSHKEVAKRALKSEIETYNQYSDGEIYYVEVYAVPTEILEWADVDTCDFGDKKSSWPIDITEYEIDSCSNIYGDYVDEFVKEIITEHKKNN
jgi:hypothetical protein